MRRIIKGIANRTWKPYVTWYLREPRIFTYKTISILVQPGVFHPGFFFSTKLMAAFLEKQELRGKKLVEVGSGSGLLSILAAKRGAIVTAVDISPAAVLCTKENARKNNVSIEVLESDLFHALPVHPFDVMVVNPPYYKKDPRTVEEKAWYCGEQLDYFRNFFQQAKTFSHAGTKIFMVLSDECDLDGIRSIAAHYGWKWNVAKQKRTAWETGFVLELMPE